MKTKTYAPYVLAALIALVGLLVLKASLGTVLLIAILAACPLMMFFMMRGMHGDDHHHEGDQPDDRTHDHLHKHV